MRRHCLFMLLLLSAFYVTNVLAQQNFSYPFRHITQEDGLLHNNVISITQDGKGFIWILTYNGLQRYDGSRFVNYPFDLNNPNRSNTRNQNLFADKKNNLLWLMSSEIEKLDLKKNKFTLFTPEEILKDSVLNLMSIKIVQVTPALADPLDFFITILQSKKCFLNTFLLLCLPPRKAILVLQIQQTAIFGYLIGMA